MADLQTPYRHKDLSIDRRLALHTAAGRLAAESDGTYGRETVERLDPAGVRPIRDEPERRVRKLLDDLDVTAR